MRSLGRVLWTVFVRCPVAFAQMATRNQNLFFVIIALIWAAVLAGVTGHWLFYRGAYILGGLIPICYLWARIHAHGLEVEIERATDRLQVGQEFETRLFMKSSSMFTKLWLEIEDQTNMPGSPPKTVITLPAKRARNWKVRMRCGRRGIFDAGPIKVTTGDPFGLFRITRRYGVRSRLLVLPQPQELPYFWAPAAMLPGEGTVRARTHYITPNASGVREYYPGDGYSRIHWKSTARLGRLMVKTFEMDPTSNIWICLDLHRDVQRGQGDESTEEYGVRVVASLANHFLQQNRMCGLFSHGAEPVVLDPSRGGEQLSRVLESLAVAEARGAKPLAELLQEEGRRIGRHTTFIVVTSSMNEEWLLTLGQALHQGARAAVILLDADTFGGKEQELPLDQLGAMGVVTYVVPAQSDLSLMLGPSGIRGDSLLEREPAGAG
ncbi:MAG TPA: DUF58 domain-containing protein [Dehalococcoidia bacterium]|nr:DUF58 domain-containing protein [Dehalococcoidia bacterium]